MNTYQKKIKYREDGSIDTDFYLHKGRAQIHAESKVWLGPKKAQAKKQLTTYYDWSKNRWKVRFLKITGRHSEAIYLITSN